MSDPTCMTCRHVIYGMAVGYMCRRTRLDHPQYEPRSAHSYYGAVNSHDWCGEYEPIPLMPLGEAAKVPTWQMTRISVLSRSDFVAMAKNVGATISDVPMPGDSFTVGDKTWVYEPDVRTAT